MTTPVPCQGGGRAPREAPVEGRLPEYAAVDVPLAFDHTDSKFTVVFGNLARIPSDGVPNAIFSFAALVPWT